MDVSSPVRPTISFCNVSRSSRYYTFSIQCGKKPAKSVLDHSIPFLKLHLWGSFAARRRAKLPVYAHFRRPPPRRNLLREKLIPRQDLALRLPEVSNSDTSDFENLGLRDYGNNAHESSMNFDDETESGGTDDSKGMVVFVNEDQILRRNRIQALSLKGDGEDEEDGEVKVVKYEITRARRMTKDIEAGAYQLRRNSSIVRFVEDGKKSSLASLFHFISTHRNSLVKIFPRIGFMVLCISFVLVAVRKFFVGYYDVELTKEETEMLRRKKKSRMESENSQCGSVEVLQKVDELPVIHGVMPQMNRNVLMENLMQVKSLKDSLVLPDHADRFTAEKHDFDKKVREIRNMVRNVHEAEHNNQTPKSSTGEQVELPSSIVDAELQAVGVADHAHQKSQSAKESEHTGKEKNIVNEIRILGEEKPNAMEGEHLYNFGTCGGNDDVNVEAQDMRASKNLQKILVGTHLTEPGALNAVSLSNKMKVETNNMCNSNMRGEQTIKRASVTSTNKKSKTKIITSLKEAKEYLNSKRRIQTSSEQPEQPIHVKGVSEAFNNQPDRSDGNLHILSETTEGSGFSTRFSVDNNTSFQTERSHGSIVSDVIFNENEYKIQSLFPQTEVIPKKNVEFQNEKLDCIVQRISNDDGASVSDNVQSGQNAGVPDLILYKNDDKIKNLSVRTDAIPKKNEEFQNVEPNGLKQNFSNIDGPFNLGNHPMRHNSSVKDHTSSGSKIQNETIQQYQTQSYNDHPYQNNQVASSKDILPETLPLSALDKNDWKMLNRLSDTHSNIQEKLLDHVVLGNSENINRVCDVISNEIKVKKDQSINTSSYFSRMPESAAKPEITPLAVDKNLESLLEKNRDGGVDVSHSVPVQTSASGKFEPVTANSSCTASKSKDILNDLSSEVSNPPSSGNSKCHNKMLTNTSGKNWIEENLHLLEPTFKKVGAGFNDNYNLAKIKAQENPLSYDDISKVNSWGLDDELEWMKDEKLQEIVFQVRDNELAGKDPFHLMDADDQKAFFEGLERKAEKVNEKLAGMHEWIHSMIENLDYGADGISIYDPLEKIVPRWKGPPINLDPEFIEEIRNIRKSKDYSLDKKENLQKSHDMKNSNGISSHSPVNDRINLSRSGTSTAPKTLIESSDGSSRPGKKNGKEHWQHTKRWSQGFLEIYNSETNPEVKAVLRDMGKDLDKWATEKEIKDAAKLITRLPENERRYIEKKVNRIKREVQTYGASAVVNKYKEYAEEKQEDYLWWLDLHLVLCIELYYFEDKVPRIGFYSLEMAEDLELNPKQYHVVGFEDPGDSKNFCHIVQAHMNMLGPGKAFVVARHPKDAFRDAKANGFNVTMIRKGQIKLNVDQTLEEVEEELKEIGSKFYYEKIADERGADIHTIMKGVVAYDNSCKRS